MTNFIPALIWALIIFALSVSSGVQLPEIEAVSPDKLGHGLSYAILTWLILRALRKNELLTDRTMLLVVAISSIYGAMLEIVQFYFLPNRFFEFWDIIANIIGSIAGYYLFKYFFN